MSATKATQKWVTTATDAELKDRQERFRLMAEVERNPLKRSSYRECLSIVQGEINKREAMNDAPV